MQAMETHYYCERCNVYFKEDRLPNINRRHHCGEFVKIIEHSQEKQAGESE